MAKIYQIATVLYDALRTVGSPSHVDDKVLSKHLVYSI